MNYFEVEDHIKELFPDKKVTISFDDLCLKEICQSVSNGLPHNTSICCFNKVKADIQDVGIKYFPIKNHRGHQETSKTLIGISKKPFFIPPEVLEEFKILEAAEVILKEKGIDVSDELVSFRKNLNENFNRTESNIKDELDKILPKEEQVLKMVSDREQNKKA